MGSYLFDKYQGNRCDICLRSRKCAKSEHDIILCSSSSYYKGPGDENLLSKEEKQELGIGKG